MFVLQYTDHRELRLTGLQLNHFADKPDLAKFDLMLSVTEQSSALGGNLIYSCDLYEAATMSGYLGICAWFWNKW